jgi:prepilin-type N-terminal cleavage/methylation domain-containing protein
MKILRSPRRIDAFTLIELLVVISIIAILASLAMVGMKAAFTAARKAQAKTGLSNIVTGVKGYYTDYGRYPLTADQNSDQTAVFGAPGGGTTNDKLMNVLRCPVGWNDTENMNPRQVKYMEVPPTKDTAQPKNGISTAAGTSGQYMDPWGVPYVIFLDGDYDGSINVKSCFTKGFDAPGVPDGTVQISCGAASIGLKGSNTVPAKAISGPFDKSSDLVSWQ